MGTSLMPSPTEADIVRRFVQGVPVDLRGMAAELGLDVHFDPLPSGIAGKLERDPGTSSGFRVVVNVSDPPRRQRFTLAHELAHYLLHRDLIREGVVDDALYRSNLGDDMERQADRFAAQLLLPAEEVRRAFSRDKALARLAQTFDVSDAALRIRLKELGLGA